MGIGKRKVSRTVGLVRLFNRRLITITESCTSPSLSVHSRLMIKSPFNGTTSVFTDLMLIVGLVWNLSLSHATKTVSATSNTVRNDFIYNVEYEQIYKF